MKKLLAVLVLGAASFALAETITLKSGEKLDGQVTGTGKDGAVVEKDGVRVEVGWDYLDPEKAVELWEAKVAWDDVKGLAELAEFADEKGLADAAKRAWEKVLKVDADHAAARAGLGYVKEGTEWVLAAAKKVVDKVAEVPQPEGVPKNNLEIPAGIDKNAILHDKKGNEIIEAAKQNPKSVVEASELAVAEYRKAIKIAREFALAHYHLGIAYQFTKDYQEAAEALLQAVKLNPRFFEAFVELGDAYAWMRDEEKAVENYRKAIEINPDYALAWRNMAMVELKRRHLKEAREACDKALKIDANDPMAKAISPLIDQEISGPKFTAPEIRKKSKHFEVITDGNQKVADTMSEHLENIYAVYEKVFPKIEKDDLVFPVIVYKDAAEYQGSGAPPGTGGYFQPLTKKLVFFWMGDQKVQDTLMVLYHETFHSFLDYYLEDATQWFNEGHGDYFGAWIWDDRQKKMFCRTNWWRLPGIQGAIRGKRFTPVKQLLQMTQAEMYNPQSVGVNYAEAWSIVYFMWNYSGGKYATVLRNYFFAMQKGSGIKRAYDQTFGRLDMQVFQDEWERYTLSLEVPPGVTPPKGR
ncbi:MAG: tetratricopeptide repeat protein [Planctomycetes bacterium]|nr:tetratricopeptide repeat protein [Planctomycetota bacterium]